MNSKQQSCCVTGCLISVEQARDFLLSVLCEFRSPTINVIFFARVIYTSFGWVPEHRLLIPNPFISGLPHNLCAHVVFYIDCKSLGEAYHHRLGSGLYNQDIRQGITHESTF